MEKTRYRFDRLPMVLFLACLAVTVVAASHTKTEASIDNLYSPLYYGDKNVSEGKQFWITCRAEEPISWYKDGEPIESGFVRRGDEEFTYTTRLSQRDDLKGKIESTLSVSHAVLRHKGKYQCNIKHENAHILHVHPVPLALESDEFNRFESVDDHDETRMSVEESDPVASTITMLILKSTKRPTLLELDSYTDKSHETIGNEPSTFDDSDIQDYDTSVWVLPTSTSSTILSLTNSPSHATKVNPTHATTHTTQAVHTTHVIPSEVKLQDHHSKNNKGKLEAKYDGKEGHKLFKIGKLLSLTCLSDEKDKDVVWSRLEKDGEKNVKDIPALQGRYHTIPREGRFMIEKALFDDAGNYSCSLDSERHVFVASAAVNVKIPDYLYVIEEEKLEILCIVKGTSPTISWEFQPDNGNRTLLSVNDRIKLASHDDVEDAKVIIEKAQLSDRGHYFCNGSNEFMEEPVESKSYVRVKDKLAALWPFLGICAEVFVLCAIILIYEKRRNKTEIDESDTDQSPDQKNDHNMKDSDVRHRK